MTTGARIAAACLLTWVALFGGPLGQRTAVPAADPSPAITVHFSPKGGAEAEVLAELATARRSVRVLAYCLTSAPIASALLAAHRRGVDVRIVCDPLCQTGKGSKAQWLAAAGVPVAYDARHALMHEKVIVIDGEVVLAGSFNWSAAAEKSNAENLLTIRDAAVAAEFLDDWAAHWVHATGATGR